MNNFMNYGYISYWDERYKRDPDVFEWYQSYDGIRHLLNQKKLVRSVKGKEMEQLSTNEKASKGSFPSKSECRVLILGCGNSLLGEDMMKDGWVGGISNVDYSSVVIQQMKAKYNDALYRKIQNIQKRKQRKDDKKLPNLMMENDIDETREPLKPVKHIKRMVFECVDATKSLPFSDKSFDLIICKGTLDSILCSAGSQLNIKQMMNECHRVLHDNHGLLFIVSYGSPDNRMMYLENEEGEWWDQVDVYNISKPHSQKSQSKYHYAYACFKNKVLDV